ncbi:MAG: NAD(P)/FAD-dependent oxidoreductase [Bacteroidota bacterium]
MTHLTIKPSFASYDVIILGAGPAGATAALALQKSGLKIALVDKHSFPRDKICGDAIGGRVRRVLAELDTALAHRLDEIPTSLIATGWRLVAPSGREVTAFFKTPGKVCARYDFDDFLFREAIQSDHVDNFSDHRITDIEVSDSDVKIHHAGGMISGAVLIACDGANSIVARKFFNRQVLPDYHSGAVRAYFKGVKGIQGSNLLEIHLIKGRLPGYFWIFPLPDNRCNVGFGMLTRDLSERRIDLKTTLKDIIKETPELAVRFREAKLEGKIQGFGLPLGGRKIKVSTTRILLCGDAASLIDPLNGEGIGNAVLSGKLAAEWVQKAFDQDQFSEDFLSCYDTDIHGKLLDELKFKLRLQKLFNRPWLIELLVRIGSSSSTIRNLIASKL